MNAFQEPEIQFFRNKNTHQSIYRTSFRNKTQKKKEENSDKGENDVTSLKVLTMYLTNEEKYHSLLGIIFVSCKKAA